MMNEWMDIFHIIYIIYITLTIERDGQLDR